MTAKQKTRFQAAILMLQETMAGIGELMRAILDDDDEDAEDAPKGAIKASAAAKLLGVSRATLHRQSPNLPFAFRVGRVWRYDEAGLLEWKRKAK